MIYVIGNYSNCICHDAYVLQVQKERWCKKHDIKAVCLGIVPWRTSWVRVSVSSAWSADRRNSLICGRERTPAWIPSSTWIVFPNCTLCPAPSWTGLPCCGRIRSSSRREQWAPSPSPRPPSRRRPSPVTDVAVSADVSQKNVLRELIALILYRTSTVFHHNVRFHTSQLGKQEKMRPMGDFSVAGVSHSSSVAWHWWLGDRKNIWPVKSCTNYPQRFSFRTTG